ncbi:MAG: MFS transporter [Candidatus Ranarchaeia archaeon]
MKVDVSFIVIIATAAISLLGMTLLPPVIPWMIEPLGASESNIGLVMSVFTLPQIVVSPFVGMLADRVGRKVVLIPSLVVYSVAGMLVAFSPSLAVVLLLRFCQGAAGSAFYPLATAIVGDLYQGHQRQDANALLASIVGAVGIVIPAIGGFLAVIDWRVPFFLYGSGLIVAFLVWRLVDLPRRADGRVHDVSSHSNRRLFVEGIKLMRSWPIALTMYVSLMLFGVNLGCLLTYYPILVRQRFDVTQALIGVAQAVMFAASAISSLAFGPVARRLRTRVIGLSSFVLYTISLLLLPLSTSFIATFVPLILGGFGFGMAIPLLSNEILEATPSSVRATESAIYQAVIRLGQTVIPLLFGLVVLLATDLEWTFVVGFWLACSCVLLYAFDFLRKR